MRGSSKNSGSINKKSFREDSEAVANEIVK
jgi:hypothetical protein